MSELNPTSPAAPATAEANPAAPAATTAAPAATPPASAPAAVPAAAPAPERVVPENYDLKLSEGSLIDSARVDEIKAYAKENKLTNEEAQKILAQDETAVQRFLKSEQDAFESRKAKWIDEIKADKDIGAENAPKAAELTSRFIQRFGDPEFQKVLETTGLGNHPGLVKMLYRGLQATDFGEGSFVIPGAHGAPQEKSHAEILYGNKK